ncbi:hypothetical protein [Chitinophaga sancti]|uniref:Uncharacterized protein n=1 Tax=Chitinophaga sancti TaxID=1004 RepID=A0A1K1S7M6_9BACT|nr:hypothetical protein [Chitinophaga sancti]WQD62185.1 hypothetical protein U0033_30305 [Chitinophaga sancti]WQG92246.1 hypothetical protein SR876_12080 [Chitinophaga sancti]SFW80021.1 hypothetical protein SAMN05661012_04885 [Chitinophaga sancti]
METDSVINLLSELVCNISIKDAPLITKEAFEEQKAKLNEYEKEIQVAIFRHAVLLSSPQYYNDIISSYSRVLSHLENCLTEALPDTSGEGSFTVSLQQHTLSAVQRLKLFIDNRFFHTSGTPDSDKPLTREKLKLNIAVSVIATLMSAFVRSGEHVSIKQETAIMRFAVQLFSSKQADEIAFKSFQNHYRMPERAAIAKSIEILKGMIQWLREI